MQGCSPPHIEIKKKKNSLDTVKWSAVSDVTTFSRHQPLKSADDLYIRILKSKTKKWGRVRRN
jgi:hypothetical protein